jgi:hypothetical protein
MKKTRSKNSTYFEKLKDPRWQRKRLEVLSENNFSCESCGDTGKTLHVHHVAYKKGAEPWEYSSDELQCLCDDCHAFEHELDRKIDDALREFKLVGPNMGYMKDFLLGFLQASTFGYGPYWEEIELFSYEQAQGIARFYGLSESDKSVRKIIDLAKNNKNVLLWGEFLSAFQEEFERD